MTDETKTKLSLARKGQGRGELNAMSKAENRAKIAKSMTGQRGLYFEGSFKRAIPGSDKWNLLISEGFRPKV
jgi:hypothetical protein